MSYKLQGHTEFQGLQIAIENRKGSIRSGKNEDGTEWKTKLTYPYGYIKKTEGTDGDEVDCFIGNNPESQKVFVIHTQNPETGQYDEDKVFLGFDNEQQARDAFNQNYDSPCFIQDITQLTISELKEKLQKREGKMLKAIREAKALLQKGMKIKDLHSLDLFAQNQDTDVFTGKTVTKDGKTYRLQVSKKDPTKRRYMKDEGQEDIFGAPEEQPPQQKQPDKKDLQLFDNQVDLFGSNEEEKKPEKKPEMKFELNFDANFIKMLKKKVAGMESNLDFHAFWVDKIISKAGNREIEGVTAEQRVAELLGIKGKPDLDKIYLALKGEGEGEKKPTSKDSLLPDYMVKNVETEYLLKELKGIKNKGIPTRSAIAVGEWVKSKKNPNDEQNTQIIVDNLKKDISDNEGFVEEAREKGLTGHADFRDLIRYQEIRKEILSRYEKAFTNKPTKKPAGEKSDTPKEPKPVTGKKKRIDLNAKVRELLNSKTDKEMTAEDKALLRQYTGRGNLGGDSLEDINLTEFYTLTGVTEFIWSSLRKLGFSGGRVLEPSSGTGAFLESAPHDSLVSAVEIDDTSGRICNILYGDNHDVMIAPFEQFNAESEGGEFQAVVGNCPFGIRGETVAIDLQYKDFGKHEQYFLQRSIDALEENGLLGMVFPTGIMDNEENRTLRLRVNKEAEFLGAIRMPVGAFQHADAQVTTDILFFRKRPQKAIDRLKNLREGELNKLFDEGILDAEFVGGKYFEKNPQYALGEEATGQFGTKIWKGKLDINELNKMVGMLKMDRDDYSIFEDLEQLTAPQPIRQPQVGDIKIINGRTYRFNENHRWERVDEEKLNEIREIGDLPEEIKTKLGIENLAQLMEYRNDVAKLWNLDRDDIAYIGGEFADKVAREISKYTGNSPYRSEILKKAVILGLAIHKFQKEVQAGKLSTTEAQMTAEKLKLMLEAFNNEYGNPHELKLKGQLGKTSDNPLLFLLGAINSEGVTHKIFDDPLAFFTVYHPSTKIGEFDDANILSIVQYLYDNEMPADLEMIKQHYSGDDDDLERALLHDSEIFIDQNGNYAPINEVCMGDVYSKLDKWAQMRAELKGKLAGTELSDKEREDAVLRLNKLEEQDLEMRRRADIRSLDFMPVSMKDIRAGLVSQEMLNDFLSGRLGVDYSDEIVWDKEKKMFTFKTGIMDECYMLFASKGANDKDDKYRLAELLRLHFSNILNPKSMLVLNKLNGIPNTLRDQAERERFDTEYNDLEKDFLNYLKNSEEAEDITERYNRMFNNYIQKRYDNSPIEGIEKFAYNRVISTTKDGVEVVARDKAGDHTWETVRRMYEQGKGMIAHGVGLGKTLEAIVLTLLHKQTGKAKKPLIVTPKSVLVNWVNEIEKWTEGVNYLVVGYHKDHNGKWIEDSREERRLKLLQLADNKDDYDLILMSRDTFKRIDFSPETKKRMVNELVDKYYPFDEGASKKAKKKREVALQNLTESVNPTRTTPDGATVPDVYEGVFFENLGIDMMIRDEFHDCKNFLIPTMTEVSGLNASDASRSIHNFMASKVLRSQNNEKGFYGLTATPISNSPLEVFNMMLPFSEKELENMDIKNMDDFINKFANIDTVPVTDTDTKVKMKKKFAGWSSPEMLRNTFFRFTDYRTKDTVQSVKANIKFPEERRNHSLSELNAGQKELMQDCLMRIYCIKYRKWSGNGFELREDKMREHVTEGVLTNEDVRNIESYFYGTFKPKFEELNAGNGDQDKINVDVYFKVQMDMIKICADLEWYQETASEYGKQVENDFVTNHKDLEKFKQLTDGVSSIYKNGGKQIVFAINKKLHDKLKKRFMDAGIPADQIAIVNASTVKDAVKRAQISADYNSGKYKVIIGNYATMGEGLNFNNMTSHIHHIQPTWNYLQIEQGNGRGIRQGNPLDFVDTISYLSKGSIDSFMVNKILDKGGMVDKFMKGEVSTWDDEIQADGDEMIIELSGNPEQARLLKESRNRALETAIREKNKKSDMRDFAKLFEAKNTLKRVEAGSKTAKQIEKEIENIKSRLNSSENFDHKEYLTLNETPILIPEHNVVIPVGSVVKYGYSDSDLAVIDSFTPSTGRVQLTGYSSTSGVETKTMPLKDFVMQYGEDRTILKQSLDVAGMFKKMIIDEKTTEKQIIYKLPKDIFAQHRKDILKNLRAQNPRDLRYTNTIWKNMDGQYKIGSYENAFNEIDNEGGKIIFPQDDDQLPVILDQMINKKYVGALDRWGDPEDYSSDAESLARDIYGDKFKLGIKKAIAKLKGEVIKDAPQIYPTEGVGLIKKLGSLVEKGYLEPTDKGDILRNMQNPSSRNYRSALIDYRGALISELMDEVGAKYEYKYYGYRNDQSGRKTGWHVVVPKGKQTTFKLTEEQLDKVRAIDELANGYGADSEEGIMNAFTNKLIENDEEDA